MKQLLFAFFSLISGLGLAQDYNKWSLGLNTGSHIGMSSTEPFSKVYQINHFNGHIRYMKNNRFGWKFDMAYDRFKFGNGVESTNLLRFSVQPVINLTNVLHLDKYSSRFGALAHVGIGYAALWNGEASVIPKQLLQFNTGSVDEIFQLMGGLTPQFKVDERLSLNMDLSFTAHMLQQSAFNFQPNQMIDRAFSGYYWNVSVGATYYIGKHKRHADWDHTPILKQDDVNRTTNAEKHTKDAASKLPEAKKNNEGNAVNQNTKIPADTVVNEIEMSNPDIVPSDSKISVEVEPMIQELGQETKTSLENTPDATASPVVSRDLMTIDTDGDGVVDGLDECITVKGTVKGCPEQNFSEKDAKTLADYGIWDILFVKGSYYLNPKYYSILDNVVKYMAENPSQKIAVSGHTDIDGPDDINNKLSEARVKVAVDYLLEKGVNKKRLVISHKGKKETKYTGNTEEIDALNRRVQFAIVR